MGEDTAAASEDAGAIPTVPGWPLLGNTLQLAGRPAAFFSEAYRQYGPVFRVNIFFRDYIVLAGKEGFDFFAREGERYFSRSAFYARFAQELGTDRFILGEPADRHQDLRRQMRVAFSREVADPYIGQMVEAVDHRLAERRAGSCPSAMELIADIAFEQYGYVMCGRNLRRYFPAAHHYAHRIMNVGAKIWPEFSLRFPRYRRARREVFELMDSLLAQHGASARGDETYTIMDALAAVEMDDGQPIAESDLVACSLYGFVGTLVYINRAAAFLLYDLLTHPETFERVQAEVDATFAHGTPDSTALRGMDELRSALKESMRLHPIALALPFISEAPFEFNGCRVPAGEYCVVSGVPNHFSDDFYRCPHAFDPDRIGRPRSETRPRGAYVPYGFSARTCPAVGLVETIILTTVATLMHRRELAMYPRDYELAVRLDPLPGPSRKFSIELGDDRIPSGDTTIRPAGSRALEMLGENRVAERPAVRDRLEQAYERRVPAGEYLIREGESADAFYILVEGEVAVTERAMGEELARLRPGQSFGEKGLLGRGRRTADCRATIDSVVLVVEADAFHAMVAEADLVGAEIAALAYRHFLNDRLRRALPAAALEQLEDLADDARVCHYNAGGKIIRQGDSAEWFYVVLRGAVEVVREGESGKSVVARLGSGDCFGEVGIVEGRRRTASVYAADDSEVEVLAIPRDALLRLTESAPAVHNDFVAVVMQRLQAALGEAAQSD